MTPDIVGSGGSRAIVLVMGAPASSNRERKPRLAPLMIAIAVLATVFATTTPASARADAGWVSVCGFSRHRMVDPIMYPGVPGAGHLHDFYGSKRVTASATVRSLRRGGTSCAMKADTAGYWAPALYFKGNLVRPRSGTFYYRNLVAPKSIRPFPAGLKMIAGNSKAKHRRSTDIVYFGCSTLGGADPARDHPIDCRKGWVTAHVNFPDCWDGKRIDSADHKRHMAYSIDPKDDGRYRCPRRHPVPVPRLIYAFQWPVHDGTRIKFASGPFYTLHADFWNAWRQTRLRALVRRCFHGRRDCGKVGT